MKTDTYYLYFSGRLNGAQGIHHPCFLKLEACSPQHAWERLHGTHEVGPDPFNRLWYFASVGEPMDPQEAYRRAMSGLIQSPEA